MSINIYIVDALKEVNFNDKIKVCRYIVESMRIKYNTDKLKIYTNEQLDAFLCKAITSFVNYIDSYDS